MTTTAAAWRHVERMGDGACRAAYLESNPVSPACLCRTPTPDPEYTPLVRDHEGRLQPGYGPDYRCTCGHALEAVR
jgi:hypothetical protein